MISEPFKAVLIDAVSLLNSRLGSTKKVSIKLDLSEQFQVDLEMSDFFKKNLCKIKNATVFCEETEDFDYQSLLNKNNPFWLVDPLDGSLNFSDSTPFYGFSLSYISCKAEHKDIHCIYSSLRNSALVTFEGNVYSLFFKKEELICKKFNLNKISKNLSSSILFSGIPSGETYKSVSKKISKKMIGINKIRMLGSAVSSIYEVIYREKSVYFETGIYIWDVLAGSAIAKQVGLDVNIKPIKGNRVNCEVRNQV